MKNRTFHSLPALTLRATVSGEGTLNALRMLKTLKSGGSAQVEIVKTFPDGLGPTGVTSFALPVRLVIPSHPVGAGVPARPYRFDIPLELVAGVEVWRDTLLVRVAGSSDAVPPLPIRASAFPRYADLGQPIQIEAEIWDGGPLSWAIAEVVPLSPSPLLPFSPSGRGEGEVIPLRDDGAGPDRAAGDRIYTGAWLPPLRGVRAGLRPAPTAPPSLSAEGGLTFLYVLDDILCTCGCGGLTLPDAAFGDLLNPLPPAEVALTDSTGYPVALRVNGGRHRAVYMGFRLQSVVDPDELQRLVAGSVAWLRASAVTSVEAASFVSSPRSYGLSQNFPNPFNGATEIRYQLPEPGMVSLVVYDAIGRRVRTLVNGRREAGHHRALWDGTDDAGQAAASGIYLYRLSGWEADKRIEAGKTRKPTYVETRRMVLVK